MKAWSAFYPDVAPELPGAPYPMVDHWLRNAASEFFDRSKAYVVDLASVDAVANQMAYTIPLAANTELVEVITAWFSGDKLTPKGRQFLEREYVDWMAEVGTPEYYTQQDTMSLLLVPAPSAAETGSIKIKAAIKPGIAATGVDDWLFSQYRLAIAAGAKAKMMAMPNVGWANPERAALNEAKFEDAISTAITKANSGYVRARPRFSGSFL